MNKQSAITRLHTQEYGTLGFDPSVPCIIATHFGFATDDEFKDLLNLGLDYSVEKKKEYSKIGWLADTLQMDGNSTAEWAASHWNPRLLDEGIYHLAFVSPNEVFANMQISDYVTLSPKIETASFENIETAKGWLRESLLQV
jgi:hypothetical protein